MGASRPRAGLRLSRRRGVRVAILAVWLLVVLSLSASVAQLGAAVPGVESCRHDGSVAVVVCLRAWGR
jgi:hypothetical protein